MAELDVVPTVNAPASGSQQGEVKTESEGLLGKVAEPTKIDSSTEKPSEVQTLTIDSVWSGLDETDKLSEAYDKDPTPENLKAWKDALAKVKETKKAFTELTVKQQAEAKAKAEADAKLKAEQASLITAEKLQVPADVILSKTRLEQIAKQAKELGLTLEQAQSRLNEDVEFSKSLTQEGRARMEQQGKKWVDELQADPNLGGKNWERTNKWATSAIVAHLGEEEGKKFMAEARALNVHANPLLVKLLASIGSKLEPKALVTGAGIKGKSDRPLKPHEMAYGKDEEYNPIKVAQ